MPKWVKGQSGNPGGRPTLDAEARELRELARMHGPRALGRLAELLESGDGKVVVMAAREILDRGFGKAMQPVAETAPDVGADDGIAAKMMRDPDGRRLLDAVAATQARLARDPS